MDREEQAIIELLKTSRTIAIVGLSADSDRPSNEVAHYLQSHGYRIVPVNPLLAGQRVLGETCHATLREAAVAVAAEGGRIDIVDCFRRSEFIAPIVDDAIAIKARCVWMQLGVVDEAAAAKATAAGLLAVTDKCLKIEHGILMR
jgi:hypothetical protein